MTWHHERDGVRLSLPSAQLVLEQARSVPKTRAPATPGANPECCLLADMPCHVVRCLPCVRTSELSAVPLFTVLDFLAGAFSAVWLTYSNGLTSCDLSETPSWVMFAGGLFVCLGVYFLGHRVMQTVGFGLADINFLRGFCIEFASTAAVVLATFLNLPVSTTHCQVGAVIFVGWTAFGRRHVKWGMFGWIGLTWIVTLPLSAGLAAVLLAVGRTAVLS